jgi:hypothetical protein
MTLDPIFLDAGHGGSEPAGKSTPVGVQGPGGTQERELTLELSRRVQDALTALGALAQLTRDDPDDNPTLRDRTFASRSENARGFVSIHFNRGPPGSQGCEVWVHERASGASQQLAEALLEALRPVTGAAAPSICQGSLAVLDPAFHAPGCAACLVEVSYLSDAGIEASLQEDAHLAAIAEAMAGGILVGLPSIREQHGVVAVRAVEERFDVWHEVPLVQQLTGMSCWAAAAAMLVGWRDRIDIEAEEVAAGAGYWEAYRDGLTPEDVQTLADAWGLVIEPPRNYTVSSLRELLERNGPLWVGEASPGLHVVVITGMRGDGTPHGTQVRIADPWPVGTGERYSISFAELQRNLETAAGISGVPAQVLHTSGRGRSRSVFHQRREVSVQLGSRAAS